MCDENYPLFFGKHLWQKYNYYKINSNFGRPYNKLLMNRSIRLNFRIILIIFLVAPFLGSSQPLTQSRLTIKAESRLRKSENWMPGWEHTGRIAIDSLSVLKDQKLVQVYFTSPLSYIPLREPDVSSIEKTVRKKLGRNFKKYAISLYSDHHQLNELIPNVFRNSIRLDSNRVDPLAQERIPVVRQIGKEKPVSGLFNNNIAVWDSHGWYFDSKSDRWKWQRARLFGSVEDMSPMSYVLPYLVPMLENSGATVLLPRERDWQSDEVLVDNDRSTPGSELVIPQELALGQPQPGFLLKDTLTSGQNPFLLGTSLFLRNLSNQQIIKYIPEFKQKGRYSVSVSYHNDSTAISGVNYTVYHAGGKHSFW